jgi:hypothetical protein
MADLAPARMIWTGNYLIAMWRSCPQRVTKTAGVIACAASLVVSERRIRLTAPFRRQSYGVLLPAELRQSRDNCHASQRPLRNMASTLWAVGCRDVARIYRRHAAVYPQSAPACAPSRVGLRNSLYHAAHRRRSDWSLLPDSACLKAPVAWMTTTSPPLWVSDQPLCMDPSD